MSENELNEIREIRRKILELIGRAQTETAISLLKEFLEAKNPSLYSKLVLISNRFHELKQKQTLGLSFEDSHLNDVNYDFINFVNSLESKLSKTENLDSKLLSRNAIGVIGISLMGIIAMWLYLNNSIINNERNISIRPEPYVSKASNEEFTPRAVRDESKPKKERIEHIQSIIRPDNKKDVIRLVYHSNDLNRFDTFFINTDWTISELKREIVYHFKIEAQRTTLLRERSEINSDKGEAITLSELISKGKLKEFDRLSIDRSKQDLANNEDNPFNGDIDIDIDAILDNPRFGLNGSINNPIPTSGLPPFEPNMVNYSGSFERKDNIIVQQYKFCEFGSSLFSNGTCSIGEISKFTKPTLVKYIYPSFRPNENKNKRRKNKKYIVTSKYGIIEENEIFIVRESNERTKYADEEE